VVALVCGAEAVLSADAKGVVKIWSLAGQAEGKNGARPRALARLPAPSRAPPRLLTRTGLPCPPRAQP
jgi:hypothetical protein